ncbi:unnamed protein product [Adineta steineri]|uniref:TIR domain-containing protein n=1 Tax=Adineta steineri TaxID=433720 RepID=A0A819UGB4_9BILA|nr:unnamed protein product [Adineta steineri]
MLSDNILVVSTRIDAGYIKKSIEWIRTDIYASHISALGAFGRALISLAISNEQSEEKKKLILDTCETLYKWRMEAEQYLDLVFDGIHLSEVLKLLHRAFTNTYIIKYILGNENNEKPTPIQYFTQLFLSIYGVLLDPELDELEKRAVKYLLKILLQISSYPEYLKELIDNNQFCIIIESLANHPKRDDAKRIWCNIQQMISPNESKKEMSSMIYISYEYTNEEFVKELCKKITIPIWVDYENVELCDDMWEYLYPIITWATTVVTLISTAYGESMDKFQELSYIISANKLKDAKKALIVVTIEHNFNFKQSRMKDLLHDKIMIPYENNISYMISKVCERLVVSKKSMIKCLQCQVKNIRKKTADFSNFSAHSNSTIMKSVSTNDSSSAATNASILIATKKYRSYPIVANLSIQTGCAGRSNWI